MNYLFLIISYYVQNYSKKVKKLIYSDKNIYITSIKNHLFTMVVTKHQCKNSDLFTYSGKETSPLGLGYCPDVEALGKEMVGRDGNIWVVKFTKGCKTWTKCGNKRLERENPVITDNETYINNNTEEIKDVEDIENIEEQITNLTVISSDSEKPKKKGGRGRPKKNSIDIETTSDTTSITSITLSDSDKPKKKGRPGRPKKDSTKSDKEKEDKPKPPRVPNEYNKFISKSLKDLRAKHEGEGIKTTEFMKMAIIEWKKFKEESNKT